MKRSKGNRYQRRNYYKQEIRKSFLIVCEGEKTEPNYFRKFPVKKEVKVTISSAEGNTIKVIKEAKKEVKLVKINGDKYDEVWVVFDEDSCNNFDLAINQAKAEGFKVAYSNEAFELWYLLHFDYIDTGLKRQQYKGKLTTRLGHKYKKNDPEMYDELFPLQDIAIKNAEKRLAHYKSLIPVPPKSQQNPSTTVHLLVQKLNKNGRPEK